MSITSLTNKPPFVIFQVLYQERSVVKQAYIHVLYNFKKEESKFYSEDSLSSTCIFSAMLCYYWVIINKTTTTYIGLSYGINPQAYLISAFSIKVIAKPTLS